ncbi:MAG: tyrosine-type recombinase/integrase [Phycisphaerales bacterium]
MHSFRHGYVTALVRSGVPVKAAQRLARHSDPRLTLNVYAHFTIADDRAALAQAFGPAADHALRMTAG